MARNTGKTISEAEFRRLWDDPSITVAQIGERLGIRQTAVSSRAKTRNFPPRPARGTKPICDVAQLTRMWLAGVAIPGIAEALGCNEKTVRNTRVRLGLPERSPGRWKASIGLADFRAVQLRDALAARAREEQAAMINAEMVDNFQALGRALRRAA